MQQAMDNGLRRWLDERLGIQAFYQKYGRKVFPVHSTFFFGEMAMFAFVILVLTGIYLGLIYVPSNAEVELNGQTVPQAYASVQLIESIPVANLFRSVHHWAAHLMVASIFLHALRIYFTGTYRKPREVNWAIGIVLLGLTLMAGFVGYSLPYDSYAVTATGIGYAIARSIPWVGDVAAELFFGGAFPTLGSVPRLYTIHVFVVPALIALVMGLHLLIIVKQKHTQPGYARKLAEPGKVLGVPLLPYQALLAGQLLMLMFGALFLLSAVVPPHELRHYGPPGAATPEVKPDWYLLWIYGFLKIIPSWTEFRLLGATFSPNFYGGLLFPALVFGLMTFAPWLDRTNRRTVRRFEYLEPPRQTPVRLSMGIAVVAFIGTLFLAAFYDEIGMTLGQIWAVVVGMPIVVGAGVYLWSRRWARMMRFEPQEELPVEGEDRQAAPVVSVPRPATVSATTVVAPQPAASDEVVTIASAQAVEATATSLPVVGDDDGYVPRTIGERGEQARESLVAALQNLGELAPAVEGLRGRELLVALEYVESLRLSVAESGQMLQGAVRGEEAEEAG
ncbi:MAG: cytochrome b-561 [Thermomicrobiales bacterium]|nr:cytochrome b-561 [Thermomicrobiales bacterium]